MSICSRRGESAGVKLQAIKGHPYNKITAGGMITNKERASGRGIKGEREREKRGRKKGRKREIK